MAGSSRPDPPRSENRILAAAVGGQRPLNGAIDLLPYDPAWPALFARLERRIQQALEGDVLLLEHVGSTSVPGLSAKPIVDVVLAVTDSSAEASYLERLEQVGFVLRVREPDWYEHRLLKSSEPQANLHVFSEGCEEIDRMLLFRDWLRDHPGDKVLYEEKKRELAACTWKYTQDYADAKSGIVREILARARRDQILLPYLPDCP